MRLLRAILIRHLAIRRRRRPRSWGEDVMPKRRITPALSRARDTLVQAALAFTRPLQRLVRRH